TDQAQSRPVLLKAPTLTQEEKFNADADASGMTPGQARQQYGGATDRPETTTQDQRASEADSQPQRQHLTETQNVERAGPCPPGKVPLNASRTDPSQGWSSAGGYVPLICGSSARSTARETTHETVRT